MLSPVEQMRAKFKKRRKEAGGREDSTLAKLAMFTSTIRTTKKLAAVDEKKEKKVTTAQAQQLATDPKQFALTVLVQWLLVVRLPNTPVDSEFALRH